MRSPRALLMAPVAFVAILALVSGSLGAALFALPFVALAALLLTGRFVGEARIHALRAARTEHHSSRAPAKRWGAPRPARAASLHARSPRTLRGPPAAVAA